jgi:hypothetical protein
MRVQITTCENVTTIFACLGIIRPEAMPIEKVFIATPTAGGIVTAAYAGTLIAVTLVLKERNLKYRYTNFDGSDLVAARNYLANSFLQDTSCSHILFVDSDMAVAPETLSVMVDSHRDFIGTIYPERKLDLEKYGSYLLKGYGHKAALASSMQFNVLHFSQTVNIENGLCRVKGLGFGFVLIARSVFEKLIAQQSIGKASSSLLRKAGLTGTAYDFFSEIVLDNNEHLSEDYSFCERVNRGSICDIWALIGRPVGHVGQFTFGAPYIEKLMARRAPPEKVSVPKVVKQ